MGETFTICTFCLFFYTNMATSSSAKPFNQDFEHYRGDTFERFLTKAINETLDLSTLSYKMQVWSTTGKVLEFSSALNGGITATASQIRLYKTAAQMRVEPGSYKYDLEVTFPVTAQHPEGFVRTWMEGQFTIKKDVTVIDV